MQAKFTDFKRGMSRILLLSFSLLLLACFETNYPPTVDEKINGLSLVATRDSLKMENIEPVLKVNASHVALMPFGFIRDADHPEIIFNRERQWFGETVIGIEQHIEILNRESVKVMLKPQLWVGHGIFTGQISMADETAWIEFENSYRNFILAFAEIAEKHQIPIFCIGTELENFVIERQGFWWKLIKDIRTIYHGKLTYASNWDEYSRTPFWTELDYVGIDAYFPITDEQTPSLEKCLERWKEHRSILKTFAIDLNKPILFTEFGYRSVDFSGKEPWNSDREMPGLNHTAQYNALEALFKSMWAEEWFAGGFVWKWFPDHQRSGGEDNTQFTPQNKPAERLIEEYYSKIK